MENKIVETEEQVIEQLENMSNENLANIVNEGLKYDMVKDILIKPLEPIKLKRMINTPVESEDLDEEGKPLMTMELKETEVDSSLREGIILSLPTGAAYDQTLKVGMTVVYPHKFSIDFDLFRDSVLVKPYDIVAKVK